MSPAEFRTLRMSLGLSAQDIATVHEVNIRTAQRWEATHTPPADVQAWILERWAHYADMVGAYLDRAEDGEDIQLLVFKKDADAFEVYGMSANEATALVGHIAMALTQCDFDFEIIGG